MATEEMVTGSPARFRRVARQAFRRVRGTVLVSGPQGEGLQLEGSAAVVWLALDEPADLVDLVARIARTWPEIVATDPDLVDDALALLVSFGLVEVVGR